MSTFTQTMEKFAKVSNLEIEIAHEHFIYLTLSRGIVLGVGRLDQENIEFKINCSSDYPSLSEIPEKLSVYFMSRNNPIQIGNWIVEHSQTQQVYYYALHFVVAWSSLDQQRFNQIVRALENEFILYGKFVSGF